MPRHPLPARLLPLLPATLLLSHCAKEAPPAPRVVNPLVGKVSSVDTRSQIVLIEAFQKGPLPSGVLFHSYGPSRTASLRPTGERVRNLHAADLLSGETHRNDLIYTRSLQSLGEPPPEPDKNTLTPPEEPAPSP